METEHPETVMEKITSYVKDLLGAPHEPHPDVEAEPETGVFAPTPTVEEAMRIEPRAYTTETAAELNAESARREDGAND